MRGSWPMIDQGVASHQMTTRRNCLFFLAMLLLAGTLGLGLPVEASRLRNISTRGEVLTGNDVMIAGFIIGGSVSKTVVVNVAGPSLANYGITNGLADPTVTLVRSLDNAVIGFNDNWQSAANAA